jgi:hypothetical protein
MSQVVSSTRAEIWTERSAGKSRRKQPCGISASQRRGVKDLGAG